MATPSGTDVPRRFIGGILFLTGAGQLIGAAFMLRSPEPDGPGVVILGGIGTIMALIGLTLFVAGQRRAHRLAELRRNGVAATGVVTSLTETGTTVNDRPLIKIGLRVTLPDKRTYQAQVKQVVPLTLLVAIQPGAVLPVTVDPADRDFLIIDWDRTDTLTAMPGIPVQLGLPGAQIQFAAPANVPAFAAGTPLQVAQTLPGLPVLDIGHLPREQFRAAVCRDGAPGRAIVDKVREGGTTADGRKLFYLGMWVQMDAGPSARHDDAPTPVDPYYATRVVPGVTVPIRAAMVDGISVEVLLWELM